MSGDQQPPSDRRKDSLRLAGFDYSTCGPYFITCSCSGRKSLLGKVKAGRIELSPLGKITKRHLGLVGERWDLVVLDTYSIMPNHLHLILWIIPTSWIGDSRLAKHACIAPPNVSKVVGHLKAGITREARKAGMYRDYPIWQRGFYDHIIRNEESLNRLREYVASNVLQRELAKSCPNTSGVDPLREWWEERHRAR